MPHAISSRDGSSSPPTQNVPPRSPRRGRGPARGRRPSCIPSQVSGVEPKAFDSRIAISTTSPMRSAIDSSTRGRRWWRQSPSSYGAGWMRKASPFSTPPSWLTPQPRFPIPLVRTGSPDGPAVAVSSSPSVLPCPRWPTATGARPSPSSSQRDPTGPATWQASHSPGQTARLHWTATPILPWPSCSIRAPDGRGILRDLPQADAAALAPQAGLDGLDVLFSRGIPDAAAWNR